LTGKASSRQNKQNPGYMRFVEMAWWFSEVVDIHMCSVNAAIEHLK